MSARARGVRVGLEGLVARLRFPSTPRMTHCPHCGTAAEADVPSCPFCAQPLPVAALPAWRRNGSLELAAVAVFFVLFAVLWIVIFTHDRYR